MSIATHPGESVAIHRSRPTDTMVVCFIWFSNTCNKTKVLSVRHTVASPLRWLSALPRSSPSPPAAAAILIVWYACCCLAMFNFLAVW